MSKKHFIAIANAIRIHNSHADITDMFSRAQLETLADAFKRENSNFMRERWLDYIAGECGPNGGAL